MKSQWLEHKGKRILSGDLSNFKMDISGLKAEFEYTTGILLQQPEKSVLMVVDLRGTIISPETLGLIKSQIDRSNKYIRKGAIVGLTGARKTLFDLLSKLTRSEVAAFDAPEPAMDWLVK